MCVKKHELDCQFILGQNEQLKPYGWTIHENAPWILATHPRSLSDSKMKSSINSDRIFYKTAAMARFVSVDS